MTQSGSDPPPPPRQPAVVVGGARRRLNRRQGNARSTTLPTLTAENIDANPANRIPARAGASRPGYATNSNLREAASGGSMNFYSPHGGQPAAYRQPYPQPLLATRSFVDAPPNPSPASSTSSVATPAEPSKKKHGFFHLKLKDNKRSNSSDGPSISSPIPQDPPHKAQRFFGLENAQDPDSDAEGVPSVRRLQKKASSSLLTKMKSTPHMRASKDKKEDVKPEQSKGKKAKETDNSKARRLLDFLPSHGHGTRPAYNQDHAVSSPTLAVCQNDTEGDSSSDVGPYSYPDLPLDVERLGPTRRTRKKRPKSLDRMTPITEASHDTLSSSYRNSEYDSQLGIISEYEPAHRIPPRSTSLLPRSHTEFVLPSGAKYELDEADLTSDDDYDEDFVVKDHVSAKHVHPGDRVDLNQLKWQQPMIAPEPAAISRRSPLQAVENRLLDFTKEDIEKQRAILDKLDAERHAADARVAEMKASHEQFKAEFETWKQKHLTPYEKPNEQSNEDAVEQEDDDDDVDSADLNSIRSSIDTDEEPIPYVARAVTITRVTPGMVKLIDIPPRKKKTVPEAAAQASDIETPDAFHTDMEKLTIGRERPENIPSPPPPKDRRFNPSSRLPAKHYCINNGHIFHPVRAVQDSYSANSIETQPYIRTPAGLMQLVRVPILCDRCSGGIKEESWECEVPVCRMVLCKDCAFDMDEEHKQRAVTSWAH